MYIFQWRPLFWINVPCKSVVWHTYKIATLIFTMSIDNCMICASDEATCLDIEEQPSLKTKAKNCKLDKVKFLRYFTVYILPAYFLRLNNPRAKQWVVKVIIVNNVFWIFNASLFHFSNISALASRYINFYSLLFVRLFSRLF